MKKTKPAKPGKGRGSKKIKADVDRMVSSAIMRSWSH